ncbi:PPC domain-containing protein [Edwardsiella piscicida]|uniref:Protein YcgK n=3 Tax=Edwardsiella TaxID=635 RepID=A0A0H3DVC3_EDWTF|nr:PPC domain-containing protein [Edwardsiella piscicida]ACY84824.1 bacterial pre-peptidase C-terminal domain protein [Edwardsiella tarda EIB202]ADM41904.1 Protein YcgK precursor [Edwardsiella tarda FL6-60]BAU80499.1 hypothetical protein SAMD00131843_00150 [Edwardsiella tarda]AGH73937.1 Protein YcgK [Edwardsiella piscicida C07-087]AOP43231.1 PPC domain-containing protein [Edwardsiella piscicida]
MKWSAIASITLLLSALSATAVAAGRQIDVVFPKGHDSARYSGTIKGYDYDAYFFRANKDQRLRLTLPKETVAAVLFGPGIDDAVDLGKYSPALDSQGRYTLPASGKYELRILQSRAEARRKEVKPYRFTLQIAP